MPSQIAVSENSVALPSAFDTYVDRCQAVLSAFFGVEDPRQLMAFRVWIFDSVETAESAADTMHIEPLYIAAEFLGIDVTSAAFREKEKRYPEFAYGAPVPHTLV